MIESARLIRYIEFANGWTENREKRRGIGPHSGWIERGPRQYVNEEIVPLIDLGWSEFWFHCPGGVLSMVDDGTGNKIPKYEFDQLAECKRSGVPELVRIYEELPEAYASIRHAGAKVHHYGGRLSALTMHIDSGTDPTVTDMFEAVNELLDHIGTSCDSLGFDNEIPDENTAEFVILDLLRKFGGPDTPDLIIEPMPIDSRPHLFPYQSCIAADYLLSLPALPVPYRSSRKPPIVLGRKSPGSLVEECGLDAYTWARDGFAYGAQHHIAGRISPRHLLEMGWRAAR